MEGGFLINILVKTKNAPNILVKTKNAPKALKRKINLNFFCDMGIPILGEGALPTWENFPA